MPRGKRACMAMIASTLALAGLLLSTTLARAEEPAGPNRGKVSLGAGFDIQTAYFFRGILQEDQGFIFQPWAEMTFDLYEGSDTVNSVSGTLGIWNSIHSGPTGDDGPNADPRAWYEFDFYGGVTFGLADDWEAGAFYTIYTSPNGVFTSTQEIAFSIAYDDSDLLGAYALSPHVLIAFEFQGGGATGPDTGTYLELGVEPGFTAIESEKYPVTLSFPLTLGLSLDDYYQDPTDGDDDTFGYFDAGVVATVPLAFMPADYGSWEAYVKVDFLFLGDSLETINNGDDFEVIGTVGVAMTY